MIAGIVGRRCVDKKISLISHNGRLVEVLMNDPMRNILDIPRFGLRSGNLENIRRTPQVRIDRRIRGVERRYTIGDKEVVVQVRLHGREGDTPNSLVVFGHGQRTGVSVHAERDLARSWIVKRKRDRAIGVNVWGLRQLRRGLAVGGLLGIGAKRQSQYQEKDAQRPGLEN